MHDPPQQKIFLSPSPRGLRRCCSLAIMLTEGIWWSIHTWAGAIVRAGTTGWLLSCCLWAGGMAGIAIADWPLQYEDTAETLKAFAVALFGGTPQEKPAPYVASSPITYAAQVAAPVLMIQGRHDTRCPPRQAEVYEAKM
jgi:hypothetical protein